MKHLRTARAAIFAVAAFAAACSDASQQQLAPSTPVFASGSTGKRASTPERDTPLARDITGSFTIERGKGGEIRLPEAGLRVVIPGNALPAGQNAVTISVTAFSGDQYAYEFKPSGLKFNQPLRFEQDLGKATLRGLLTNLLNRPVVAYFGSRRDIDPATGVVVTLEDLLTDLDLSGHRVKADIWHFSGYVVAWGRGSNSAAE